MCFWVTILRSILDNESYYTINNNLTDGSVGARKCRSVRDSIFVISAVTNSLRNAHCETIQLQVMEAIKYFDKLWLQSCINSLYEAGIDNDYLNLLYIDNRNANIAVKINNQLSSRISVKDVVMQGSVWGSLKCTIKLDTLNKTALSDDTIQYYYCNDPNIPIGVLGMINDTLGVSKCGKDEIKKNALIHSFMKTHRLTFSR